MILGMQICEVLGNVVCTQKVESYRGWKLMTVRPLALAGQPAGVPFVAVDSVDAGPGDRVLVCTEGGSANIVLGTDHAPVASVIVGIVDAVELERSTEEEEERG